MIHHVDPDTAYLPLNSQQGIHEVGRPIGCCQMKEGAAIDVPIVTNVRQHLTTTNR